MIRPFLVAIVLASAIVACAPGSDCLEGKPCSDSPGFGADGDGADGGDASVVPGENGAPFCTVFGKPHIGLGGQDLAATADGPPSGDRARAKPYSALVTEYGRVLGSANAPPLIASTGPTFGIAPDNWFLEPIPSAVFVSTAFEVAFQGCGKLTGAIPGGSGDAKYETAPTQALARTECAAWGRAFWSHDATPDQLEACIQTALDTTIETYGRPAVDETTRAITPQRQWAYACATVLTATGFLTF